MFSLFKKYPYLLLIIIAIAGYFQVSFFQNTLKWDVMDQYYPWRMFVVQCLRNGIMPFWNPYEQLGYPMHADPQSGVWYPLVWIFALFGDYTLYSVQAEYILHIALGGIGMMLLLQRFHVQRSIAFMLSIAYMFCGLFIGNAQHLTFVIAACWMPYVLLAFKNMAEHNHWRYALHFSLFGYLLVSGGYPAFSIILFYLLTGATVYLFIINRQSKHWMKRFLLHASIAVGLLLLCSSALLFSVIQSADYLSRAEGLPFKTASFGPFSPQSLLSLLFPLASAKDSSFFDTDISMSSVYMGLLPLAGLLLLIIRPKSRSSWLIFVVTILMLFASFGSYTPVFGWLYNNLPMMNLFRFPSVFRLFFIIGALLLSGCALSAPDMASRLKKIILFFIVLLALVVAANHKHYHYDNNATSWHEMINHLTLEQSVAWQALIQLGLCIIAWIIFRLKHHWIMPMLVVFTTIDMVVAAQLNIPVNVTYSLKTKSVAADVKQKAVHDFQIPEIRPIQMNNDSGGWVSPFWRNLNLFKKQPAWDGYNSFQLKNYIRFVDDEMLRQRQLRNNWVYFADSIVAYNDEIIPASMQTQNVVYVPDSSYHQLTGLQGAHSQINVETFNPGYIKLNVSAEKSAALCLMQQYYPGWNIYVDGTKTTPVITDYLFMTIPISEGKHQVAYVYENTLLHQFWKLSLISLVMTIIGSFYALFVKNRLQSLPQ
jgi:hypothetical protein